MGANLVHIKNDIRSANKLSLDENLWKGWPVTAQKNMENTRIASGWSSARDSHYVGSGEDSIQIFFPYLSMIQLIKGNKYSNFERPVLMVVPCLRTVRINEKYFIIFGLYLRGF